MSEVTQGPTSVPSAPGGNWAAGWYADPWFPGQQRYWDGGAWTTHVDGAGGSPRPAADPYAPSWGSGSGPVTGDPHAPPWGSGPGSTAGDPYAPSWGPGSGPATGDPYAPPWASGAGSSAPGGGGWLATDHRTPPPPRRRRGVMVAVAVVVVAVAAAGITVASGSGERKRPAASGAPAVSLPSGSANPSGPPTTIPPAVSTDPGAPLLSRLDVAQSDAPPTYAVGLLQGGNLVTGQVTLDLCNGTYASEALRTARRQVDLTGQPGRLWLSTEAVLYANPAATTQAFSELRARAANCPSGFLAPPPGEEGLPSAKTVFNAAPDATWAKTANVDRLAYDFTTTDQQGTTSHSIAVYLRRGRALMGVYFANPVQTQPAIAGKTTVAGIVGVFEQRLAQLPASVVNGSVPVPPPSGSV